MIDGFDLIPVIPKKEGFVFYNTNRKEKEKKFS